MANNKNEETKIDLDGEVVKNGLVVEETKTDDVKVEETKTDDVKFKPADLKATKFAVYEGDKVVKIYDEVTHGADFAKIAKGYAERKGLTAKEYFPELELAEKIDPDTVTIVTTNNQVVRVFSLAAHGKGYEKLAEQFIAKYGERKGYKVKQ